jgi:hypothetical protein
LAAALWVAACVIIPYRPASETERDLSQAPHPERVVLSVGRRTFLDAAAKAVAKEERRIQRVDGQAFIDAASPDQPLTLARLLDAATAPLIAPLDADYLVLFADPEEVTKSWGDMMFYLGFVGLEKDTTTTTFRALVIDLRKLEAVEQLTTRSTGTSAGIGAFYGLFVVGDTSSAARAGVVRHIAQSIAAAQPIGTVRVVFLSSEPLVTQQELTAETAARAEAARLNVYNNLGRSIDALPAFQPSPLPTGDRALIYLFRPVNVTMSVFPVTIQGRAGNADVEIVALWAGGYYPRYVASGEVRLWVAEDATQSVTFEARSGETYYVEGRTSMGWTTPREHLNRIVATRGASEVRHLRLLPSAGEMLSITREGADADATTSQLTLARLYSAGITYADGTSVPKDLVEAYKWYSIAFAGAPKGWLQKTAQTSRDALGAQMDAEQIAHGQRLANEWRAAFDAAHPARTARRPDN